MSDSGLLNIIKTRLEDLHGKIDRISKTQPVGTPDVHPSISSFEELRNYPAQFGKFIDELHIQTVIFDPDSSAPTADVVISVITSNGQSSAGSSSVVKGKVIAIYDTKMELNGNVTSTYPSEKNIDATMLNRRNTLVNQMCGNPK
jgi:hypothetical protein